MKFDSVNIQNTFTFPQQQIAQLVELNSFAFRFYFGVFTRDNQIVLNCDFKAHFTFDKHV